jgi:hypothetical protein
LPTNRIPVARPWRSGRFTGEVLSLFARLDRVPERERQRDEWQKDSRRLAALLGEEFLDSWFCGRIDVLDPRLNRDRPGFWGGAPLMAARQMREKLLEAVKLH